MYKMHFAVGKIWIVLLIVILGLLFALPVRGDAMGEAKAAFENGEFDTAVGILAPRRAISRRNSHRAARRIT